MVTLDHCQIPGKAFSIIWTCNSRWRELIIKVDGKWQRGWPKQRQFNMLDDDLKDSGHHRDKTNDQGKWLNWWKWVDLATECHKSRRKGEMWVPLTTLVKNGGKWFSHKIWWTYLQTLYFERKMVTPIYKVLIFLHLRQARIPFAFR